MVILMRILAVVLILVAMLAAETGKSSSGSNAGTPSVAVPQTIVPQTISQTSAALRVEGEKRFRTNCGRCHMPPHKFPPRMMATIVRHMRVRALITDEDMRYILAYMTE
jgi:mono/diheme cytochrome c family protein